MKDLLYWQVRAELLERAFRIWDEKVQTHEREAQGPASPAPLWYWDWPAFERMVQAEVQSRCQVPTVS